MTIRTQHIVTVALVGALAFIFTTDAQAADKPFDDAQGKSNILFLLIERVSLSGARIA